jgi:hypothetical protein
LSDPENQYYLAIEEINEVTGAEIFGRRFSVIRQKTIIILFHPSNELREYIESKLGTSME